MTESELARQRLRSQGIAPASRATPHEVVRRLGAVQAQAFGSALWAVGLRMEAATEALVEQAIRDKTIVRTWPMRGTLHLVAAEDARWLLALLTPRILANSARRHQQLDLDEATFARAEGLFAAALESGAALTRSQMMAVLEQGGIATAGQRGYHLLGWAAQRGLTCFGPRQGKQDTFVWLETWLPPRAPLSRDESLAELARRYFSGHGPATLQDLMWWSGLPAADARAALALAEPELELVERDGQRYWSAPALDAVPADNPTVHLLPAFDEFLLGYRDRSAVLDAAHADKVVPGGNGVFKPLLVVEGRVVGTWKPTVRRGTVQVALHPFAPLDPAHRAATHKAAARYGAFLGLPATVVD